MLVDSFRDSYYNLGFCTPVHTTAILLIPGTADFSPHSTHNGFQPYYMSAEEITTYWSNYNNTDPNPIITQLPNINTSDGSTVEKRVWENGDNCVRVEELKVINGDHDWPGTSGNMDISATVEIWNFVSKFDINGLIDCNNTSNQEINNSYNKKISSITDMLGRDTKILKNIPLFYIYDDGTVEKKIIIE